MRHVKVRRNGVILSLKWPELLESLKTRIPQVAGVKFMNHSSWNEMHRYSEMDDSIWRSQAMVLLRCSITLQCIVARMFKVVPLVEGNKLQDAGP